MSLALLRTGCLSTLCFSNQLGRISAWMKASETSILAWRKNQTDGCYARVPHASPWPGASLLKSDPVCSRNEPLFLNSMIRPAGAKVNKAARRYLLIIAYPWAGLCVPSWLMYSSPHLYKEGISIPILQLGKTEATGPRSPRIRTQDCWTPEPQAAYSLPTTSQNPSLVIYQLISPASWPL